MQNSLKLNLIADKINLVLVFSEILKWQEEKATAQCEMTWSWTHRVS